MFDMYSPNMLKTFEICPLKFRFKYIKKLSMPVNDEVFELGKNIHALASYYLRKEFIDKMENSLNAKETELWSYLKNIKYFTYEYINSEYSLSVKIEDCFYGGRIDALVKKGDMYYILDYKTGAVPKNAKFDYQTMIYILAVRTFFNTNNVKFVYIDLKNKTDVEIELTENLVRDYEDRLMQVTEKIKNFDFSVKKNTGCNCEYSPICY